jgi:hypothetical protein
MTAMDIFASPSRAEPGDHRMESEKAIKSSFPGIIIARNGTPFPTDKICRGKALRIKKGEDVHQDLGRGVHEGWRAGLAPRLPRRRRGVTAGAPGTLWAMLCVWVGWGSVESVEDG